MSAGTFEARLGAELDGLAQAGRRRALPEITARRGHRVTCAGQELLNLCSNDYLGLGGDAALAAAFHARCAGGSPDAGGMAGSASRLLAGNHPAYAALEAELGELYGGRAACVFNSGYHANVGILAAVAGKGDVVLCDRLDHASLLDGVRLSGADFRRYRHGDLDQLESLLRTECGGYRQVFIVSETVFSMDGDVADVTRLVQLKQQYGAVLVLDEAHAVGVIGDRGLGVCEAHGAIAGVDIIVGTFGKALASLGAFAISAPVVRDYLVNHMRTLIFTTALPPAVVEWTRTTLARAVAMRDERRRLAALAARLRDELRARGLATGGATQIVPVLLGADEAAVRASAILRSIGYLALPIRPPTVPPGTARLRLSLCADMTWDDLAGLVTALHVIRESGAGPAPGEAA